LKVIKFTVDGVPQAQMRRVKTKWTNYDPSADNKKDFLQLAYDKRPETPILGAVILTIKFVLPRPNAHFGTGKNAGILKASAPTKHIKKPDEDNLVKLVKDALNKTYWKDDAQVWKGNYTKVYGKTPRTEVTIENEE